MRLLANLFLAVGLAFPQVTAERQRFERPAEVPQVVAVSSYCSGFVVAKGIVATAAHCARRVQEDGNQVELRFSDGRRSRFRLLSFGDVDHRDVALLAGDTGEIEPVTLAAKAPVAGTVCLVVGHGGGSPTQNAHLCEVRGFERGYLQLSATIVGGDSGSPVYDFQTGEVFGIAVRSRFPVPSGLAVDAAYLKTLLARAQPAHEAL